MCGWGGGEEEEIAGPEPARARVCRASLSPPRSILVRLEVPISPRDLNRMASGQSGGS